MTAIGGLAVAAGAAAYFTSTGAGSSSATVGNASAVTITAGAAPSTELFPGTDGDVTAKISNPNGSAVHIGSLSVAPTEGEYGFDTTGSSCNLSFTTQTNDGVGWDVPANGSLDLDLADSIHMATTASNLCQGAAFTVYLQAGP